MGPTSWAAISAAPARFRCTAAILPERIEEINRGITPEDRPVPHHNSTSTIS